MEGYKLHPQAKSSGVVRPQRSPTALGYGQTPTPTPKENVGVTIYTYPSKNVLLMLIIRYFCKEDRVEGLTCAELNLNSC